MTRYDEPLRSFLMEDIFLGPKNVDNNRQTETSTSRYSIIPLRRQVKLRQQMDTVIAIIRI